MLGPMQQPEYAVGVEVAAFSLSFGFPEFLPVSATP
jgi:hypothetical protein